MTEPTPVENPGSRKTGGLKTLITELRQRNVFKVAVAYAITGWLMIEVVNNVFPVFDFPRWTMQFVIIMVLLGFPLALILAWMFELTPEGLKPSAQVTAEDATRSHTGRKLNYLIVISGLALALAYVVFDSYVFEGGTAAPAVASVAISPPPADGAGNTVMRFVLPIAGDEDLYLNGEGSNARPTSTAVALSPDGTLLVYSARAGNVDGTGISRLYLRRLDEERAAAIPGSEGASLPFFSLDGRWIGYFAAGSLRRVPVAGGETETIVVDVGSGARGAHWGDDNSIVYSRSEGIRSRSNTEAIRSRSGRGGIYRVDASGGEPLLVADSGAYQHYAQPHLLPGSKVLLFHRIPSADPDMADIVALDLESGVTTSLLTAAMDPRYVDTGHLLFMRQGTLMAVGFDPVGVKVMGEPVLILPDVMHSLAIPDVSSVIGAGQVAVSAAGHLVYAQGGIYPEIANSPMRVFPDGKAESLDLPPRQYSGFRLSPSGEKLAFHARSSNGGRSLHLYDPARAVTTTLSTRGFRNVFPVWSPDGRSILYASDRDGTLNIYLQTLDSTTEPERLVPSDLLQYASDWSSAGVIVFLHDYDIWVLPPGGEAVPFFTSAATEQFPAFSPDGNWLVYGSDQSGRDEVYVRPYPGPGPATQISGNGGRSPLWSPTGDQIYFVVEQAGAQNVMMAVDVTPGTPFQAGRAETFIDPWLYGATGDVTSFDVYADGSFVSTRVPDQTAFEESGTLSLEDRLLRVNELHIVLNFFTELQRRMEE